jgi:hypothetical protein
MDIADLSAIFYEQNCIINTNVWSRNSAVGIATGYGLDGRGVGVRLALEAKFFFSSRRPDWLWGPPSSLSNGYRGLFPGGKATGA